jgi:hypothetical protein
MLRCGVCGEAMLPRSARDQAPFYVCRTRALDATACPMPRLKQADVDGAALRLFEDVGLDVEGTRERIAAQLSERVDAVRAQRDRAEREAADLRAQAARLDRDYRRGALFSADRAPRR